MLTQMFSLLFDEIEQHSKEKDVLIKCIVLV